MARDEATGALVARVGPSFTLYTLMRAHIAHMTEAGFQVICICDDDEWAERLRLLGVEVVPLGMGRRPTPLAVLRWALHLYGCLRTRRVDILHTSNAFHGVAARVVGRFARVPVIVHSVHNWFYLQPGARHARLYSALERLGAAFGDAVMFVGRDDLARADRDRIVARRKRLFIGDGVDIAGFERDLSHADRYEVRASLGFEPEDVVVAMVARTEAPKDHDLFIEGIERAAAFNPAIRGLLIGGGFGFSAVEQRVQASPLARRLTLLGHRTDVPSLLRAVDLLVLASAYEAFGRSLVEGMVAGIPVVGTDVPGIRHTITNRETGLLVPYGDATALAHAIRELLDDAPFAQRMAAAGRRYALTHFDEASVAERVRDAYRMLLQDRGGARRRPPPSGVDGPVRGDNTADCTTLRTQH